MAIRRRATPAPAEQPAATPPEPLDVRYNVHAGSLGGRLATILSGEPSLEVAKDAANRQWQAGAGIVRITAEHTYLVAQKRRD